MEVIILIRRVWKPLNEKASIIKERRGSSTTMMKHDGLVQGVLHSQEPFTDVP